MIRNISRARFTRRAPRINLRNFVSASLHLENGRQLSGKLRTISVSGGLIDLAVYLDERTDVSLIFSLGAGVLQTKAELMFPMRGGMGYLQPFRFTEIGTKERRIMEAEIAAQINESIAGKAAHRLGSRPPQSLFESF